MYNKLSEPPKRLKLQLYTKVGKIKIKIKIKIKRKIKIKIKRKEKIREKIREKITCLQLNCNGRFSIYSLFKYLSVIKEILCFTFYTSLILIRKNLSKICRNKLFPL